MKRLIIVVAGSMLIGCATIVEGTDQFVNVKLAPETATCDVSQKGSVVATIDNGGGQIEVPKSKEDIIFTCSADGYERQSINMESSASGWGVVGCFLIDLCITDYSTGALNKYPETITINLKPAVRDTTTVVAPETPLRTEASPTEMAYWQSIQNSSNPEFFRSYLKQYPDGPFVPLARSRLKELGDIPQHSQ